MARARNSLTVKEVANAKPKEKPYRLSDGSGLYLLVRTSGFKAWECRYIKPATGKPTFSGLGSYPDVSLADAREKALEIRKMVSEGIDPQLMKAELKAKATSEMESTFQAVAELWMDTKKHRLKEKTIEGNWRKLELYAFPSLGKIPVSRITAPMAIAALKPLEKAGHLETVKRAAQLMNEVMTYCVNVGLVHANPLTGIREAFRRPIVKNMDALSPEELPELLQAVGAANMAITTKCLIEWQLHTMTRPNEAAGAKWSEIDFDKQLWIIPPERMKMKRVHEVPLTPQTLGILEVLKPLTGHREFVFPSIRDPKRSTDSESINKALSRIGFKGRTTAHGLRALASTTLNEQGFDYDIIEASLAHVERNAIRKAYNRATYLERRRTLLCWWSEHIEKASYGTVSVTGYKALKLVGK